MPTGQASQRARSASDTTVRESSLLPFVAAAVARAPSVHNTQPWRLVGGEGRVELWADRDRQLTVADPDGRELAVSVGAASYNAQLALRVQGAKPTVRILPDRQSPDLLVVLEDFRPEAPDPADRYRYGALPRRHTHRGPFNPVPMPPDLLFTLQEQAVEEGATLRLVSTPGDLRRVADIVTAAEHQQQQDAAYREELASWTPAPDETRRDGVPATSYPAVADVTSGFRGRDYDMGRGWGHPGAPPPEDDHAVVAVLTVPSDLPEHWVRGGRALQRVLLEAAHHWVFASLYTQPMELPGMRTALSEVVGWDHNPLVVLRLGFDHTAATTPRRPEDEFLEVGGDEPGS